MDDPTLQIIAYTLIGTTAGYVLGRLDNGHRPAGRPGVMTLKRTNLSWANSDVSTAPAPAEVITVRNIVGSDTGTETGGINDPINVNPNRYLEFYYFDEKNQEGRMVSFHERLVLKFLKCDTPTRGEYHGNDHDYSKLLAIACYRRWARPQGKGYGWSRLFQTREARIHLFFAMSKRLTTPTPSVEL